MHNGKVHENQWFCSKAVFVIYDFDSEVPHTAPLEITAQSIQQITCTTLCSSNSVINNAFLSLLAVILFKLLLQNYCVVLLKFESEELKDVKRIGEVLKIASVS